MRSCRLVAVIAVIAHVFAGVAGWVALSVGLRGSPR